MLIPEPDEGNGRLKWGGQYRMNRDENVQRWSHDNVSQIYGDDRWSRDETQFENSTVSDGDSSYQRGEMTPAPILYLNNNLRGRIYEVSDRDSYSGDGILTTIIGQDDPDVSSLTGYSVDLRARWQRTHDNAITGSQFESWAFGFSGSWKLVEGTYIGGTGYSGLHMYKANALTVEGASFLGGDQEEASYAASGAYTDRLNGSVYISNRTDVASDRFQGGTFTGDMVINGGGSFQQLVSFEGGDGLTINGFYTPQSVTILGGDFMGSQTAGDVVRSINYTGFDTISASVDASGGRGAYIQGATAILIGGGNYLGGDAGSTAVGGDDASANSMGGEGLLLRSNASTIISNSYFKAGKSHSATIVEVGTLDPETMEEFSASAENGQALALGASGLRLHSNGSTTISDVTASGSAGSSAWTTATNSNSSASGGNGLLAQSTTITINSGSFTGGRGGTATTRGAGNAFGGAGAMVIDGTLNINGGIFAGGAGGRLNGAAQMGNIGVWIQDTNLRITEDQDATIINGHLYVNNNSTSAKTLSILSGTIEENIYLVGTETTTMTVSTNAAYKGTFMQDAGLVNVNLGTSEDSRFFSSVYLEDEAVLNFNLLQVITAKDSRFVIGSPGSKLNFTKGVQLSAGTRIDAGFGEVTSTGGNVEMGRDTRISLSYNGMTGDLGKMMLGANSLIMSDPTARLYVNGAAATPTGTLTLVTGGASTLATNANIQANLGSLVKTSNIDSTAGIQIDFDYNSLANSSALADLGPALLTTLDGIITNNASISSGLFHDINRLSEKNAAQLIRYSESQLPDSADAAFQSLQQVSDQIAARGTEFRSMNGFASTKPTFGGGATPAGAAGPVSKKETMQGWIRAYGSFADRDADGMFADYESSTYGSVIGVDQSFGNMLIGLAGGWGTSDLTVDDTYQADVTSYQGSAYATLGGERSFIDLALTYGALDTESKNVIAQDKFDSHIISGYIGAGKSFTIKELLKVTPEASLLTSYYRQEDYNRAGLATKTIEAYDEWSYLATLGLNVASQHQLDWFNRNLAVIPEIRAHWLHEFNAELDDFSYAVNGAGRFSFGVRPREEDLLKLGLGIDVWNWKYQRTKIELDYDGLFSSTYAEHVISGKLTVSF